MNLRPPACEAGALTAELSAPPPPAILHVPRNGVKRGAPASSRNPYDLEHLLPGYILTARAEGKSPKTIEWVAASVRYFGDFLARYGESQDVRSVTHLHLRAFIVELQGRSAYRDHPLTRPQDRPLAPHTVNAYVRGVSSFWTWLTDEEIIAANPFKRVKMPKVPRKVINTFTDAQLGALVGAINTRSPQGYRDYALFLTLLDTGLRISEVLGARGEDLDLGEATLKVLGKGGKERVVPLGRVVQRVLWHYLERFRPEPLRLREATLFLTHDGRPVPVRRAQTLLRAYAVKAGIEGVRASPHTLRHTAAISFLRNGGDAFSLQQLLGHSSLDMTRRYCQVADADVQTAHRKASPVDNLELRLPVPGRQGK